MIRTIRDNKLIAAVVIAAVLNLTTSSIFAWVSWDARERICTSIERAFEGYTDALVGESEASAEREASFRRRYQAELSDCN